MTGLGEREESREEGGKVGEDTQASGLGYLVGYRAILLGLEQVLRWDDMLPLGACSC